MRFVLSMLFLGAISQPVSADLFSQAGPGTFDDQTPLTSEVNFSDAETISDLEIRISDWTYDWAGDLVLTLTSPEGTTVDLVNRIGKSSTDVSDLGSFSNFSGDYTFSDDGGDIVAAAADPNNDSDFVIPSGDYYASTFSPSSPSVQVGLASSFAGETTQGTWTLLIEDFDDESAGSISGWSINTLSSVPEPMTLPGLLLGAFSLLIARRRI